MSQNKAPKRSPDVTILLVGVFLLGVANLWLLWGLLRQADLLVERGATNESGCRRCSWAGFWGLLFLTGAWLLWRRRPLVRWLIPGAIITYAIYHLVVLFRLMQSPLTRAGWPLDLLLYTGATMLAAWVLNRPGNRAYFARP